MPISTRAQPSDGSNSDANLVPGLVNITIPSASDCWPARASQVGGRFRVHPLHAVWADTPREPGDSAEINWGPARISSIEPRLAVTFHQKKGSFAGLSRKARCVVSGIGPHEYAKWKDLETDPNIVSFLLQGLRSVWAEHSYTCDWVAHDALAGLVAGEVKADQSYFHDPDYSITMCNAAEAFTAAKIDFRKETGPNIRGSSQRRRNVNSAFRDRFTHYDRTQEGLVRDRLSSGDVALGELEEHLHKTPETARSIVHAMLCTRVLAFDLNLPVGPDTIVTAAPVPISRINIRAIDIAEAA